MGMESRVWILFTFLLYLGIGYGTAVVSIIGENGTVSFGSLSSQFGPDFGWKGYTFEGYLEYVTPHSACKTITKKNESSDIALIARSTSKENCTFETKVLNAQHAGFLAAIVFNTKDNGLVQMTGSKHGDHDISIASVFVGLSAGVELQAATFETGATVSIVIQGWIKFIYYLIPFAAVVGLCIILITVFLCVRWCVDARRRRRSRMSRTNLKRIPTKKFDKATDSYETCAICIEDYEQGEKLRILPCNHAYHQKCIDPWLLHSKRVCPVCKRRVTTKKRSEPQAEDDSDESHDERAPLIDSRRSQAEQRYFGGGASTSDDSSLASSSHRDRPESSQRSFWDSVTRSAASSRGVEDDDDDGSDEDVEARARADLPAVAEVIVVPRNSPPVTRHTPVTPSSNYATPSQSPELPAGFTPYMNNKPVGVDPTPLPSPSQVAAMFGAKKEGAKAANKEPECDHMGACACAHDQPEEEEAPLVVKVKVEVPRKKKKGKKSKKTTTDEGEGKDNEGFGGSGTNGVV